jgi:glycosyltransferase involved in cell wall biosynthesis
VTSILPGENPQEKRDKNVFGKIKTKFPPGFSSWLRDGYEIYYDYQFNRRYKSIFKNGPYDFIYERLTYFHQSVSRYAKTLGLPYIVEVHSILEARHWLGNSHFSFLARNIQDQVLDRADAIIVVSKVLKDIYTQRGFPDHKFRVISNAVDENLFDPGRIHGEMIQKRYSLEGKIVIGHVSSMKHYHGVDLLIKAMEKVVKKYPKARLFLIGAEEHPEQYKNETENISDFIIRAGTVPYREIPQFIASMDLCLVSILDTRGSPIKIFEYGAMVKPVIAPDLPAIRELLRHNETGFLFRPYDVDSLADAIIFLIQNRNIARELGKRLRDHILKEHTWRNNAERIIDIYDEIKGGKNCRE